MTDELEHIITAVRDTGEFLRKNAFSERLTSWKEADDPVTQYDREAELLLCERLTNTAPGNFLGEEYGEKNNGHWRTYYIDSIDGTKEWVTRDFRCSLSLGIEEHGELTGGIVHDFLRDIMYVGYHGNCHIRFNGEKYLMGRRHGLSKHRIAIDSPDHLLPFFPRKEYSIFEKNGSIALSFAELAAGNFDGMLAADEGKGHSWDVAAGTYLLKANGCTVLDAYGNELDYKNPSYGFIALREHIAEQVLDIVAEPMGFKTYQRV